MKEEINEELSGEETTTSPTNEYEKSSLRRRVERSGWKNQQRKE